MSDGIGYYRYEGFSLEQKIAWVRQGGGPGELARALQAVNDLGRDFVESEQTLMRLVNELGGNWEGNSATAAGTAMQQAAQWSAATEPVTSMAGTGVELQTESVERTRNGMPGGAPPPEYGFFDALGDVFNQQTANLFDVQTNFDEQAAQRRAADQEANRLLYAHEAASRANLAALPALPPAPRITADADIPATICPPVQPLDARPAEDELRVVSRDDQKPATDKNDPDREDPDRQQTDQDHDRRQEQQPREQQSPPQHQQILPHQPRQELPQDQRPGNGIPDRSPPRDGVNLSGYSPAEPVPARDQQYGQRLPSTAGFGGTGAGLGGVGFTGGGLGGLTGGGGGFGPSRPESGGQSRAPGPAAGVGRVPGGGAAEPVRGASGSGNRGPAGNSLMHPGAGGGAQGEQDGEHTDRYWTHSDELFRTDDIVVMRHGVIGENPGQEP